MARTAAGKVLSRRFQDRSLYCALVAALAIARSAPVSALTVDSASLPSPCRFASQPQVKAPCAPPPWRARLIVLTWLEDGSGLSTASRSDVDAMAEIPKPVRRALYTRQVDMTMSVHCRKADIPVRLNRDAS